MSDCAGQTFGLIGALSAFPRRALAREVARQGGELLHRVTRRTTYVVFGRSLLVKQGPAVIEERFKHFRASGRQLLSENGFLRHLGLVSEASGTLSRQSLLEQSNLKGLELDLLGLFDAFESMVEPFTFRDLIIAKKYSKLLQEGATWVSLARSVHLSSSIATLAALPLQTDGGSSIYVRAGELLTELNGQSLLQLESSEDVDGEELFTKAEDAEEAGAFAEAAQLYRQCLSYDPHDAVASFNQANCLRQLDRLSDARLANLRAVKLDPAFVEAWFNLGCLASQGNDKRSARKYLQKAISLDGSYADAVYNLASLEFELENLSEARRLWARYLELDNASDWARTAAKGIQYADHQLRSRVTG